MKTHTYDSRRRADAYGRLHPEILPAARSRRPTSYVYGAGFSSDTTGVGERWWELFGDTTLDALVEQALANNRDVAVAAARVQQARANLKTVRAQYLPQIGAGSHRRGRIYARDGDRAVVCRRTDPLVGTVAVRGAAQRQTGRKGRDRGLGVGSGGASRLSLAAEVATTYFTLLEYERDLSIARQTLRLRRESAALIDSMFRYGMSDGVALEQARSLVYTAEADIPQYCRAVEQTWLSTGNSVRRDAAPGRTAFRSGAATADRLPPRGHSRGTALGAAQTPPRHHARRISTCCRRRRRPGRLGARDSRPSR